MKRLRLFSAALGLLAWSALSAAQESNPTPGELMAKYVEAIGGEAAIRAVKTRVTEGEMNLPAMNLKGTLKTWNQAPSSMVVIGEFPGIGVDAKGTDGAVAWANDPFMGPRLLEGAEKAAFLRSATLDSDLRWQEMYPKAETVGSEDVGGKPAWKAVFTDAEEKQETRYFDKESGLVVRVDTTIDSPMGSVPVMSEVSDYRVVGDLKIPHLTTVTLPTAQVVVTLLKVEHNVEIDAALLAPPAEVAPLLAKPSTAPTP